MTTERNIIIHAGQTFELSLDYAGTPGRGQRMHIRASDAAADVIAILSHDGDANARVIYDGTDSLDITIGASVNGGWLVGANRVEWVYDIEDYDLSDADDVVITHRGRVIVYGNRTRADDVTPSAAMPSGDGRYVRFDGVQGLTEEQQQQARDNIGVTGGGGGSSAWGGITGTLSDQADLQAALDAKAPLASPTLTGTPAAPTAAGGTSTTQIATTAFVGAAVSTHAGAADPHGDRAYTDTQIAGRQAASATLTTLSSATAAGLALMDDATAADQRTTLGLGTAATAATGDFAAASHTHAASDVTSGTFDPARLPAATDTAQGAVELATTAEALTGTDTTRAVTAAGVKAVADTKAETSHTHAASDITSGTLDAARLPAPTTTALGGVKRNTGSAGQFVTGIDSDGSLLRDTPAAGSPGGSSGQIPYNNAGTAGGSPLWRESANAVAQRNSTNAQIAYFYQTTDGGSNYTRLVVSAGYLDAGSLQIIQERAGTGPTLNVDIGHSATKLLRQNGTSATLFGQHFVSFSDNTYDIGSSSAGWRTGYFDTSVITPTIANAGASILAATRLRADGFATALTSKTADYTATATDATILVDASGAARTITLPAASGISGRIYVIKKTDSSGNAVTVDANASETIDGATTYALSAQYKFVVIQCDGTNWHIIGAN